MTARTPKPNAKPTAKPTAKPKAKLEAKLSAKRNVKPKGGSPFWRKPLEDLTRAQWESLCDGCGRCCLVKLEDEDTGRIYFTDVTCRLFDAGSCRCKDYPGRKAKVPDCVKLTPKRVREIPWLPPTCAYRLVAEGKDLYPWHPLISGDPESVHRAGISVRGRAGPGEDDIALPDVLDRIVRWPGMAPRGKKG